MLQVTHNVSTAGHLGINKTRSRILCRYYWPGVLNDVANHYGTCEVCQRILGGNHRIRAEIIPMPLVEKPFQLIAMDIVGPLPRNRIRAEIIPMPLVEKPFQLIAMDIVGPLPRSKANGVGMAASSIDQQVYPDYL